MYCGVKTNPSQLNFSKTAGIAAAYQAGQRIHPEKFPGYCISAKLIGRQHRECNSEGVRTPTGRCLCIRKHGIEIMRNLHDTFLLYLYEVYRYVSEAPFSLCCADPPFLVLEEVKLEIPSLWVCCLRVFTGTVPLFVLLFFVRYSFV